MSAHHEEAEEPSAPGPEFNYVRIKRGKVTWFLDVNLQGTVSELKAALVEVMGTDAPKGLRLYLGTTELLDAKTLADYEVKSDDVLCVAFVLKDGTYEAVEIAEYVPTSD